MITSNESIKNSKSRLLRLSSEDKITGTNGRFTINVLSSGGLIDNVKGYIVHSIQAPNLFDNIPTYANVFTVIKTTGAITYNITIPNSYYYIDDLVAILTSTISTAIADTVVVTKTGGTSTKKFTFAFAGDEYTIQGSSTIASRLGITADLVCPDGVATTAPQIPNLLGETELYIHSRDLAPNNLIEGSGSFSVVDKLDLYQNYGGMCYSSFNTDSTHFKKYFPFESLKTLRTVRITVRNRTGEVLTLPENFNLSVMLMLFYK